MNNTNKFLITFLFFSVIFHIAYASAIELSSSGKILDDFKDREKELIFVEHGLGDASDNIFANEFQER
jgi:hypothetical protein